MTYRLNRFLEKNSKHLKHIHKGCDVSVKNDIHKKKNELNEEIKHILKINGNSIDSLSKYISSRETKVFKLKNSEKILSLLGEKPGIIFETSGLNALVINLVFFKKISFKSDTLFVIDEETDVCKFIQQFYKWYFMRNNFEGYDAKSQNLLKQVRAKRVDEDKLELDDIINIRRAISSDVESIDFVIEYARETECSKVALDKIKEGLGAQV